MKNTKIYIGTDEEGNKIYWNPCDKTKEYHKDGKIIVEKEKLILGKGLNKNKIEVGDISIKAVVGKNYKLSK